nr:oligosaccharide flippase family protein [Actinomycetota bacterium]
IAGTVASTIVAGRGLPWRRMAVEIRTLGQDLRFGVWAQLGSFFRLTNLRLDYLVMSAMLPSRELGLYATANNVLLPLYTLPAAVSLLLAVKVSKASHGSKGPHPRQLALIIAEAWRYTLVALAGGLVIGMASFAVVPLILGSAYNDSVGLIWILLPGSVLFCYTTISTAGAVAMQRVWVGILAEGAAAVATVLLLPFLLPSLQAEGAAITSSVAYGLSAVAAATGLFVVRGRARRLSASALPE